MRIGSIPLWFIITLVVMVTSQVVRLQQTTAVGWLFCDYLGRLSALALLAAIPAARAVAFRRQPLRTSWWETALWVVALILFHPLIGSRVGAFLNGLFPHSQIGIYPDPHGWLLAVDVTFGLALVAYHEEIFFRRCAQAVFSAGWGEGWSMLVLTSLLFAGYHWTSGVGSMAANFLFGLIAILCLRRIGALWPIVVAHFLNDALMFYVLPNV